VTYHRLYLRFTLAGTAVAVADAIDHITNIRAVIDGDAKIDTDLETLVRSQDIENGRNVSTCYADGILCIHLAQPWAMERDAQDGPAWGMAVGGPNGVRNATLSVTTNDIATCDLVEAWAETGPATYLGRHFRQYHITGNQAGAGDLTIDQWPVKDPTAVIQSILVKTHHITKVALSVDKGDEIAKATPRTVLDQMSRQWGKVPHADWTYIPFDVRGRPKDGLPVIFQNGKLVLTTDAALGNYDIILNVLEGVDPAPVK